MGHDLHAGLVDCDSCRLVPAVAPAPVRVPFEQMPDWLNDWSALAGVWFVAAGNAMVINHDGDS